MKEANQRNDKAAADVWQYRLHEYLDRLFAKDANAGAAYHGLQVLPFSLGVQRTFFKCLVDDKPLQLHICPVA